MSQVDPREEWEGMPEFEQEQVRPYAKIILRVGSEEDLKKLSKLLGQNFTAKTKSAWYPALPPSMHSKRVYRDKT